jgi:iron-sulfur cluster assembly protein
MITISSEAIEVFKIKLEKRHTPNAFIRIGVKGGGCNGFEYVIQFEDNIPRKKDIEFNFNGLKVVVDNRSITHLNGCTVHWEKTLVAQGFKFLNPNAKSFCGCGNSFSTKG